MPYTIGQLHFVVLDAPDAHALATFSAELLGMEVSSGEPGEGWQKDLTAPHDTLRAPWAPAAKPCAWPDPGRPQQFHHDVYVTDVDEAEPRVLALGLRKLPGGSGDFRVYADPAGHPFCLVWDAA